MYVKNNKGILFKSLHPNDSIFIIITFLKTMYHDSFENPFFTRTKIFRMRKSYNMIKCEHRSGIFSYSKNPKSGHEL